MLSCLYCFLFVTLLCRSVAYSISGLLDTRQNILTSAYIALQRMNYVLISSDTFFICLYFDESALSEIIISR